MGALSTTILEVGTVYRDVYTLPLAGVPPGDYRARRRLLRPGNKSPPPGGRRRQFHHPDDSACPESAQFVEPLLPLVGQPVVNRLRDFAGSQLARPANRAAPEFPLSSADSSSARCRRRAAAACCGCCCPIWFCIMFIIICCICICCSAMRRCMSAASGLSVAPNLLPDTQTDARARQRSRPRPDCPPPSPRC